jgi:hypothetical protein
MTTDAAAGSRWTTAITYRTETGPLTVRHGIEELDEVVQLVERGPDWNAIIDLRITLARVTGPVLTVEAAAA